LLGAETQRQWTIFRTIETALAAVGTRADAD
jgi:hypothetical protein